MVTVTLTVMLPPSASMKVVAGQVVLATAPTTVQVNWTLASLGPDPMLVTVNETV